MRRLVVVLAASLSVLTFAPGLGGEPSARAEDQSESDTQAAKIHYQAGEQYYLRGHYTEAIGEFKEAYRLSHAAALLYNISQAHERTGDLPRAREYMQRYLDSGQAEPGELAALREKLRLLDRRIVEQKAAEDKRPPFTTPPMTAPPVATTPVAATPVAPGPEPAPLDASPPRPYRTWKWVTAGTGAGCLILAGLFAADASKMAKDLEDAANQTPKTAYLNDLPDKYARGERDGKLAVAFGIGGAALAATGVVLFILDSSSGAEQVPPGRAQVLPLLAPGTAGASAAWRF